MGAGPAGHLTSITLCNLCSEPMPDPGVSSLGCRCFKTAQSLLHDSRHIITAQYVVTAMTTNNNGIAGWTTVAPFFFPLALQSHLLSPFLEAALWGSPSSRKSSRRRRGICGFAQPFSLNLYPIHVAPRGFSVWVCVLVPQTEWSCNFLRAGVKTEQRADRRRSRGAK